MKRRLAIISLCFSAVILLIAGLFYGKNIWRDVEETKAWQIVEVNELEQLALKGDMQEVAKKADELEDSLRSSSGAGAGDVSLLIIGGVCVVYIIIVYIYVYFSILRPFDKMKAFAGQIAQGNFDVSLDYQRANFFGDFTWAFDSMRKEITRSRSGEREAIENNKTVIATLSHDIKTPISSIRAYAEGLEANMDNSAVKRQKYISVIMKKCDEVSRLTDDLFLHSISDLDRLKMSLKRLELCQFMRDAAAEMSVGQQDISLTLPPDKIIVSADEKRLMQVCENIINNARKYAKTTIDIAVTGDGEEVEIHFRDYGSGIYDEDLPFIFSKFYRGKNCGNEQGSGLGLYIVKYITEKMDGRVLLRHHPDGLEVTVILPVVDFG